MKDTKRKIMPFTFYDRTGIERKLETQAAKGWLLEKCSAYSSAGRARGLAGVTVKTFFATRPICSIITV